MAKKNQPTEEIEDKKVDAQDKTEASDEIREAIYDKFASKLFGQDDDEKENEDGDEPKKKQEKVEAEPVEEVEGDTEEEKQSEEHDEDEQEDEPKTKDRRVVDDEDDLAEKIARGTARGVIEAQRKIEEDRRAVEQQVRSDDIPDAIKKRLPLYKKLEDVDPEKYKGLTDKMVEFYRKEQEYAKEWEKENEEEFDAASEEHNGFYEKHMPKLDKADLRRAELKLELDEEIMKVRSENQKEIRALQQKLAEKEFESEAKSIPDRINKSIVSAIDKELAELDNLDDAGPRGKIAKRILSKVSTTIPGVVEELYKVDRRIVEFDPNNKTHAALEKVLQNMEGQFSSMPDSKTRAKDGRKWVPRYNFSRMSKAEQSKHWQFETEHIEQAILNDISAAAKAEYDDLLSILPESELAKRAPRGSRQEKQFAPADQSTPPWMRQQRTDNKGDESAPPAPRAGAHVGGPKESGNKKDQDGIDIFTKRLLGG